jgi:hypothetical protein
MTLFPVLGVLRSIEKKMRQMAKHVLDYDSRYGPVFMFGVQVPKSTKQALELDKINKNNLWALALHKEMNQLDEYSSLEDLGPGAKAPGGYKRIRLHVICLVKHDEYRKCHCVADGHLTDPVKGSSYSGVISLKSMRIVILVSELNELKNMVGDIGNAYLTAVTGEYCCRTRILSKPRKHFGNQESTTWTQNLWCQIHEKLADIFRDFDFKPSYADSNIWIKDCGTYYEYIFTYVDDLMCLMKSPQAFFDALTKGPYT